MPVQEAVVGEAAGGVHGLASGGGKREGGGGAGDDLAIEGAGGPCVGIGEGKHAGPGAAEGAGEEVEVAAGRAFSQHSAAGHLVGAGAEDAGSGFEPEFSGSKLQQGPGGGGEAAGAAAAFVEDESALLDAARAVVVHAPVNVGGGGGGLLHLRAGGDADSVPAIYMDESTAAADAEGGAGEVVEEATVIAGKVAALPVHEAAVCQYGTGREHVSVRPEDFQSAACGVGEEVDYGAAFPFPCADDGGAAAAGEGAGGHLKMARGLCKCALEVHRATPPHHTRAAEVRAGEEVSLAVEFDDAARRFGFRGHFEGPVIECQGAQAGLFHDTVAVEDIAGVNVVERITRAGEAPDAVKLVLDAHAVIAGNAGGGLLDDSAVIHQQAGSGQHMPLSHADVEQGTGCDG